MSTCLDFHTYAQIHRAIQEAKLFKNEFIDPDIIEITTILNKISKKYQYHTAESWEIEDLQIYRSLTHNLTCYLKGLNMAEKILQKIRQSNN